MEWGKIKTQSCNPRCLEKNVAHPHDKKKLLRIDCLLPWVLEAFHAPFKLLVAREKNPLVPRVIASSS